LGLRGPSEQLRAVAGRVVILHRNLVSGSPLCWARRRKPDWLGESAGRRTFVRWATRRRRVHGTTWSWGGRKRTAAALRHSVDPTLKGTSPQKRDGRGTTAPDCVVNWLAGDFARRQLVAGSAVSGLLKKGRGGKGGLRKFAWFSESYLSLDRLSSRPSSPNPSLPTPNRT
jgi:hypothetical protein